MLSFFPRGVLDEILNLIESVSEDFPSYSCQDQIARKSSVKKVANLGLPNAAMRMCIAIVVSYSFCGSIWFSYGSSLYDSINASHKSVKD